MTQTPAQTPSETPAPAPAGEATSDATGTPTWVWWLLGALLLAAVVGVPLLVRARRRRAWRAQLAASEEEVDWFAHVLLLELQQAPSAPEVRGGWGVGEARVAAVEDRLTALAASAPDDAGRARAVELRDAVRLARERIHAVSASGTADVSRELAAIAAHLAATLGVPPPSTDL